VWLQFFDDQLKFSRLDFIKLSSYEEVKGLMRSGYAFAARADAAGGLESTLGSVRKPALLRAVEYPVRQLSKAFAVA